MAQTAPWSVKGIDPQARDAAKEAARKAGMTLGAWLSNGRSRCLAGCLGKSVHSPADLHRPEVGRAVLALEESADGRRGHASGGRDFLLSHAKRHKGADVVN